MFTEKLRDYKIKIDYKNRRMSDLYIYFYYKIIFIVITL